MDPGGGANRSWRYWRWATDAGPRRISPAAAYALAFVADQRYQVPEGDVDVDQMEPPGRPDRLPDEAASVSGVDGPAHLEPTGTLVVLALARVEVRVAATHGVVTLRRLAPRWPRGRPTPRPRGSTA